MIEPMKRLTLLILPSKDEFHLEKLRELGIVHLILSRVENREVTERARELEKLQSIMFLLSKFQKEKHPVVPISGIENRSIQEVTQLISERLQRYEEVQQRLNDLKLILEELEPWGEFDIQVLREIRSTGIGIWICMARNDQIPSLPENCRLIEIARKKQDVYFVVLSAKHKPELVLPEVKLPEQSPSQLRKEYTQLLEEIGKLRAELRFLAHYLPRLREAEQIAIERLEFAQASSSVLRSEEVVHIIQGYIPSSRVDQLIQYARQWGWGVILNDPDPDDNDVPTLLRLPKWLEIAKPIFETVGILPGYREQDVTFPFFIFLTIFFALIFGDAGYGVLFLVGLVGLMVTKPALRQNQSVRLMTLFSVVTIIWGLLSGSVFGISETTIKPIYERLGLENLWNWTHEMKNIQVMCFYIGAVHLSIAHGWRTLLMINHPRCLAEVGWGLVIWGNCFLASSLVAPDLYPANLTVLKILYFTGGFLILFFTNPSWKLHKAIGNGLIAIIGGAVNSFVDVLSYIRLFAVGLASFKVAESFNMVSLMLIEVGKSTIFVPLTFVGGILVILFGHGLNIALGALGVFVHGIRLNTLEFSGHMGISWCGIPFNPFARRTQSPTVNHEPRGNF